jgi:uncharacterized membrane protein
VKRLGNFLKTTVLGGFFALLPVVLVIELLGKAMQFAQKVTAPVVRLFPQFITQKLKFPILLTVVFLGLICFVAGLLVQSTLARATSGWVEDYLLLHLPGYRAIKGLTQSLSGTSEAGAFKPALLVSDGGQRELAYLIGDHGNGQATVMLPSSPTPMAGSVKIVARDQIEILDARLSEVTRVLNQWGVGTRELLGKQRKL